MADLTNHPGGLFRVGEAYVDASGKEIPSEKLPKGLQSAKKAAAAAGTTDADALAEDFPGRTALADASITTRTAAAKLSRDELIAIKGIGEKTADEILAALK